MTKPDEEAAWTWRERCEVAWGLFKSFMSFVLTMNLLALGIWVAVQLCLCPWLGLTVPQHPAVTWCVVATVWCLVRVVRLGWVGHEDRR